MWLSLVQQRTRKGKENITKCACPTNPIPFCDNEPEKYGILEAVYVLDERSGNETNEPPAAAKDPPTTLCWDSC